jgi:acyl-[acyl-carrier-protein]-phospholipid O-acyltransferase/long-chain-fatty-acid--[acyl-carrier-protein] ligase
LRGLTVRLPGRLALAVRRGLRALLRILFRVEVRGEVAALQNARTLIVANHESLLDGVLLGAFLPVAATFVVHTEVMKSVFKRALLRFVPHLVVDPTQPLAIKAICRLVETGTPVVIFPEGRITVTGALMKVYDGAGFVAARTGATIVPVRIEGAARSYFGRLRGVYPRRLLPKIRLAVQPRCSIAMPSLPSARSRRRRAGELMRRILTEMMVLTRPQHTLYEAFLAARAVFGSSYRLIEDIRLEEQSYGSMLSMSLGLARLLERETREEEIVGVLTPNAAPTLSLILALSARKRVPAMLNYTAGADGLQAACAAGRIRTVVSSRAFIERAHLEPVIARLRGVRVLYLEDMKAALTLADRLWIAARRLFPSSIALPQSPEDPAVVLFTSGSEGSPKGVVHSHASLLANIAQVRALADFTPHDKLMMALPLFHSFGLTCGALLPLVTGCKVFLYPTPLHYRVIPELVYDRNCTVLFGTSTFLGHYAKCAHPYDFTRLRYVVAGAEKLAEEVRRAWMEKFGIRVLEGYGVTECAPVVAVNVPMACRPGSVGQLVPGMDYELEPVPGIAVGGILKVRGPNLMRGYLRAEAPGVLEALPAGGWYSTGDIVSIDADDYVFIHGRVKRFAKIAGEMISLELIERIAAEAAPGKQHAAAARPDSSKGEALVLFTTDRTLTRDRLLAAARRLGASELAVPRIILPIEEIPLLGTGKTDHVRLKSLALEAVPTAVAS